MMASPDSAVSNLPRTLSRLHWYRLGLQEAKPGYRGVVFAQREEIRAKISSRAHMTMRSIRNKGARGALGIDRTLSRLGWYMDGLRESVPGYRGRIFALPKDGRARAIARIDRAIARLQTK